MTRRLPPGATPLTPGAVATYVAVAQGARTIREVCAALGLASSNAGHHHVAVAQHAGLIDSGRDSEGHRLRGSLHSRLRVVRSFP